MASFSWMCLTILVVSLQEGISAQMAGDVTFTESSPGLSMTTTTPPRMCPLVGDEYRLCREQLGRNSTYGFPQFLSPLNTTFTGFSIDFAFSTLESLRFDPQPVRACFEEAMHTICISAVPPCDPETGLLLKICEDSCKANEYLESTGSCRPLNEHVANLVQTSSSIELMVLLKKYLETNCSDPSTFYFDLNGTSQLHPEKCTHLYDPQTLERLLNESSTTVAEPTDDAGNRGEVARIVAGVVVPGSVLLMCILVIMLSLGCYFCNKPARHEPETTIQLPGNKEFQNPLSDAHDDYEDVKLIKITTYDKEHYKSLFSSMLVCFDCLKFEENIGEGAFGTVYKGKATSSQCALPSVVAIKTIKNLSSQNELKAFFTESLIMKDFNHPNVLCLVGVCFDTPDDVPYIILPFMVNGSLKNYLKKKRVHLINVDTYPEGLQLPALVRMCLDIVHGMSYLAEHRFVHRDLAARNCLVDGTISIKVGDFGLARDVYSSNYYRANRNARIPVKWMPPETLHDGISNEKTDVWSFGVTCWEVFALGRTPYPGVQSFEMAEFLSSGGRLKRPALCPLTLFAIMESCWKIKPDDRPKFQELVEQLENFWESHITNDAENSYVNDKQFSL